MIVMKAVSVMQHRPELPPGVLLGDVSLVGDGPLVGDGVAE